MTQEEKANAYDEALGKARRYYDEYKTRDNILYVEDMEDMFPELKESEDERIREDIIRCLKYSGIKPDRPINPHVRTTIKDALAWLEKQGKPIDKIVKRAMNEKQRVLLTETNGDANIDWDTRSLQDVKLLLEYGLDYIKKLEKQGEQKPTIEMKSAEESLGISSEEYNDIVNECLYGESKAAEWKQENVEELSEFENAMMHIGGSFFGENAGLDPNDTNVVKEQANLLLELVPKQEWSEEDNYNFLLVLGIIKDDPDSSLERKNRLHSWLKSLKDRVQPQLKQEWGEEDERNLNDAILFIETGTYSLDKDNLINWLKSLKKIHLEAE